jgi:Tfp pilus assembly protein PilN
VRAVNLLPRDEGRKRTPAEAAPIVGGLALLLVAVVFLAISFLSASASVRDKRAALKDAQQQLAVLPPLPPGPTPTEAALVGEQSSRVSAVASALSRRVTWDRVLREFATVLPDDVWLTSLSAKSPSSPASAAPAAPPAPNAPATGFVVNGYTYSQAGVARLLSRLSVLPDLRNVQLQSSALSKIGEQQVVQFTIVADLTPLGAAS